MWIGDMIRMAANARPKNEIVYTPSTMAEWTVAGVGTTKGLGSLHIVADDLNDFASIMTNVKVSTKYGLLYEVTACDFDGDFAISSLSGILATFILIPKVVGISKVIFTTASSFTKNSLQIQAGANNTNGKYIDINSLRLFELPAGSQIESDFTNLTADQLNTLYPM